MKAVDLTYITDHALTRFKWYTGNQDAVNADVMTILEESKQVTRKSVEWYAPLVRNTVVPGKAYFYHEAEDMVLICEHDGSVMRVMTLYPLPAVVCSNIGTGKMAAILSNRRMGIDRKRHKRYSHA